MKHVLLPCPCCGTEPVLHKVPRVFDSLMYIECPCCGLRTAMAAYYRAEQVPTLVGQWPDLGEPLVGARLAASWNMRVPVELANRYPVRPVPRLQ